MSFPAVLDTNVLYGALLNDYLLRLASRGLFRPLWSADIIEELRVNLIEHGERAALVDKRISAMTHFFPDAMVEGYESLIAEMTCDAKDRHVLAAAVRANAEVLVTFNLKDFPRTSTDPYDIEVVHPDDFLLDQLDLYPGPVVATLETLVRIYDSPAMTTDGLLLSLARTVPRFSDELARHLG